MKFIFFVAYLAVGMQWHTMNIVSTKCFIKQSAAVLIHVDLFSVDIAYAFKSEIL